MSFLAYMSCILLELNNSLESYQLLIGQYSAPSQCMDYLHSYLTVLTIIWPILRYMVIPAAFNFIVLGGKKMYFEPQRQIKIQLYLLIFITSALVL